MKSFVCFYLRVGLCTSLFGEEIHGVSSYLHIGLYTCQQVLTNFDKYRKGSTNINNFQ